MNEVGTQSGDGAHHLVVAPHFGEVVGPAVSAGFKAAVYGRNAVLLHLGDGAGGAPAVILEEGIRRAGIHHLGVDAAAGIVVLDVLALVPHVLQHGSQLGLGLAGGRVGAFQIHKPAVKAVVLGNLHQLVRIREVPLLIPLDERPPGLISPGQEDTAQRQNAVLVSCIGIGGVGQVHHTELKGPHLPVGSSLPLAVGIPQLYGRGGRGLTVPGGIVVDVLPEIKAVFAKLIGIGRSAEKGVAVISGQRQILNFRVQLRIGLGGGHRLNPVLQRHPGPQQIRIRVRGRVPGQQVLCPVAMGSRLILAQGAFAPIGQRVAGKDHRRAQRHDHGNDQGEG